MAVKSGYRFPPYVDVDTSRAAAESVVDVAPDLRTEVLRVVAASRAQGATCDEVEVVLGMRHQTASARVRELALRGLVLASDRHRPTRSGRAAIVWVAKDWDW